MRKGFHQFYEENIDDVLISKMKVLDAQGRIEPNQWEIAGNYFYI